MDKDSLSERLLTDIKNLVLTHKLHPVDGYEFPQERVAEFWKDVFKDRGISVYGALEVPTEVMVIQTDFTLPEEPPHWLYAAEDQNGTA